MTTPAPPEAITEKWLLENGFLKRPVDAIGRRLTKDPQLHIETFMRMGKRRIYLYDGIDYALAGVDWDTARLIKLIEALTGKEWPCR